MDLFEIIHTLHEERKRLDHIIQRIQQLQEPAPAGKKTRPRDLTPREKREIARRLRPFATRQRSGGRQARPAPTPRA
jgi:hypothetical protein